MTVTHAMSSLPAPPPPLAVTILFAALHDGRPHDLAAALAPDARYASWDGAHGETIPRATARGAAAISRSLARAYGTHPELLVCIGDGSLCLIEGRANSGDDRWTFVTSIELDTHGAITRILTFQCPEVEPSPSWRVGMQAAPAAARSALECYLDHLAVGSLADAGACFSEDCLCSHPPYRAGDPRVTFRGREELVAGLTDGRGEPAGRPVIERCLQRGRDCFVTGVVGDARGGLRFLSSVTFDADGLIQRYAAFAYSPVDG